MTFLYKSNRSHYKLLCEGGKTSPTKSTLSDCNKTCGQENSSFLPDIPITTTKSILPKTPTFSLMSLSERSLNKHMQHIQEKTFPDARKIVRSNILTRQKNVQQQQQHQEEKSNQNKQHLQQPHQNSKQIQQHQKPQLQENQKLLQEKTVTNNSTNRQVQNQPAMQHNLQFKQTNSNTQQQQSQLTGLAKNQSTKQSDSIDCHQNTIGNLGCPLSCSGTCNEYYNNQTIISENDVELTLGNNFPPIINQLRINKLEIKDSSTENYFINQVFDVAPSGSLLLNSCGENNNITKSSEKRDNKSSSKVISRRRKCSVDNNNNMPPAIHDRHTTNKMIGMNTSCNELTYIKTNQSIFNSREKNIIMKNKKNRRKISHDQMLGILKEETDATGFLAIERTLTDNTEQEFVCDDYLRRGNDKLVSGNEEFRYQLDQKPEVGGPEVTNQNNNNNHYMKNKKHRFGRLKRSATNDENMFKTAQCLQDDEETSTIPRCNSIDLSRKSHHEYNNDIESTPSTSCKENNKSSTTSKKTFLRRSMSLGFIKFKRLSTLKTHQRLPDEDISIDFKETEHQTSRRKNITASDTQDSFEKILHLESMDDMCSAKLPLLRTFSAPETLDQDDDNYDVDLSELYLPRRRAICPNLPVPAMKQLKTYLVLTRLKQYCFV